MPLLPYPIKKIARLLLRRGVLVVAGAIIGAARDTCWTRRFVVNGHSSGFRQRWECCYRQTWQKPSARRFNRYLRKRLGISEVNFRHYASPPSKLGEPFPEASPEAGKIFLVSDSNLTDERIRKFLLAKANTGQLQLIYPETSLLLCTDKINVLTGIKADEDGQDCLLEASRQGIRLTWLSADTQTSIEDTPLMQACSHHAKLEEGRTTLTYCEIKRPKPFYSPSCKQNIVPRPLRILTYRWHVPHQYELFKLEANFTLVTGLGESSCHWWNLGQRPFPDNARFASWHEIDQNQFDLAILPFDENVLHPSADASTLGADWGRTFRFLMEHLNIPKVALCHGTTHATDSHPLCENSPHGVSRRQALANLLAETVVIVNSHEAQQAWGFNHSRVIWHGFDPDEFPCRSRNTNSPRILTLPSDAYAERPLARGANLWQLVSEMVPTTMEGLRVAEPNLILKGNAYARAKFASYISALHQFDIYFNPTTHSPMPRSRGEAMLCGLATVNANSHDVDHFIHNGVNGFFADTAEELADQIGYLLADTDRCLTMGQAGRRTAMQVFHIERYLSDWRRLIRDEIGNHAI